MCNTMTSAYAVFHGVCVKDGAAKPSEEIVEFCVVGTKEYKRTTFLLHNLCELTVVVALVLPANNLYYGSLHTVECAVASINVCRLRVVDIGHSVDRAYKLQAMFYAGEVAQGFDDNVHPYPST